ncbi:LOW QUALITY PROTEIN: PDZ domain-containing protein 4-like [Cyanocitta cristata]
MGCNMCVVQKPEEQHRVMLQVSGKEGGSRRGGPRGSKEPLVLQVLRRSPRGRPPPHHPGGVPPAGAHPPPPWGGPGPPPAVGGGLVDSGTQTDISFESRRGGRAPPLPQDYFDPADLGEPERPEELEYEEVELYKTSHKLGITVCYRTDGEEDPGIYVGEVRGGGPGGVPTFGGGGGGAISEPPDSFQSSSTGPAVPRAISEPPDPFQSP